jgi:ketosteroid isomerase-like protein
MLKRFGSLLIISSLPWAAAHASAHHHARKSSIPSLIKAEVADEIAGINAHDAAKATAHEAGDTIAMESGRPPIVGKAVYERGLATVFRHEPDWRLRMVDEAVDVAKAGDMAIYRSTYDEDSAKDGVPYTHRGNYVAGFKRDPDGIWRIHWSVVSWQSPSRKK